MLKRTHNSGFTLFELMVVLALIAVASALVVPAMARGYGNMELRMSASSVLALLGQARTHAVYEGRSYAVVFAPGKDEAERTLYLLRDDGKQVQQVTLPAHVEWRAENAQNEWSDQPPAVHFFPDGSSEFLQLDLRGQRDRHVQVALDPLTARARVGQIYDGRPAEEVQPEVQQ